MSVKWFVSKFIFSFIILVNLAESNLLRSEHILPHYYDNYTLPLVRTTYHFDDLSFFDGFGLNETKFVFGIYKFKSSGTYFYGKFSPRINLGKGVGFSFHPQRSDQRKVQFGFWDKHRPISKFNEVITDGDIHSMDGAAQKIAKIYFLINNEEDRIDFKLVLNQFKFQFYREENQAFKFSEILDRYLDIGMTN